jgi:arylsulfatase A-like enzyme
MDIFATAAQMAGVQPASNVEGHDLLPLLTDHNAKSKHQTLFWRQGDRAALRHGPWKIVDSRGTNRGKDANRQWELYNIDSDITESENMAAAHPEQVELLQKKWNQLNREMAEPLF